MRRIYDLGVVSSLLTRKKVQAKSENDTQTELNRLGQLIQRVAKVSHVIKVFYLEVWQDL